MGFVQTQAAPALQVLLQGIGAVRPNGSGALDVLQSLKATASGLAVGIASVFKSNVLEARGTVASLLQGQLGARLFIASQLDALRAEGATRVLALLDARMDEVYGAAYVHDGHAWRRQGPITLGRPESVVLPEGFALAGNAFEVYGERLPAGPRIPALPTATAMLRVAPARVAAGGAVPAHEALPLYVRDKVAQTTAEREALRAAKALP